MLFEMAIKAADKKTKCFHCITIENSVIEIHPK